MEHNWLHSHRLHGIVKELADLVIASKTYKSGFHTTFCKAMDEMVNSYGQKLKEFLGGSMNCLQVTKVCFFIGHVIRMHVINDSNLQMADVVFAFEDYYDNAQTVKAKLGDKKTTCDQNVFLGTFEGLLRRYTA